MSIQEPVENHQTVRDLLEPGEDIRHTATAGDAVLAVTDRRVAVVERDRAALVIEIGGLRRIQFDIEKSRPATLVIVPEQAEYDSQVLNVEPAEYQSIADALVAIGRELADQPNPTGPGPSRVAAGDPRRRV
jgi:hypothetical protein